MIILPCYTGIGQRLQRIIGIVGHVHLNLELNDRVPIRYLYYNTLQ